MDKISFNSKSCRQTWLLRQKKFADTEYWIVCGNKYIPGTGITDNNSSLSKHKIQMQDLVTTTLDIDKVSHDGLTIVCLTHNCVTENSIRIAFKKDESTLFCESCRSSGEHNSLEPLTRLAEITFPFRDVSQDVRYDLVLIPSHGSFLEDFDNDTGLHIGIVQEFGQVLEYDQSGFKYNVSSSKQRWSQCLNLKFIDHLLSSEKSNFNRKSIETLWNQAIDQFKQSNDVVWTSANYRDDTNNCFDFVLSFIATLIKLMVKDSGSRGDYIFQLREKIINRIAFSEYFVVPQTKLAARYISLYRKLKSCENGSKSATIVE